MRTDGAALDRARWRCWKEGLFAMIVRTRIEPDNTPRLSALDRIADVVADLRERLNRDADPRIRAAIGHLLAAADILNRIDRDGWGGGP